MKRIKILHRPKQWASSQGGRCPVTDYTLKFPCRGEIRSVGSINDGWDGKPYQAARIRIGSIDYGFDLYSTDYTEYSLNKNISII